MEHGRTHQLVILNIQDAFNNIDYIIFFIYHELEKAENLHSLKKLTIGN
jgi:hypothetical protein